MLARLDPHLGEGATAGVERIPPTHRECCKARKEQLLLPGQVGMLAGPNSGTG
jgi:hypothetical protein